MATTLEIQKLALNWPLIIQRVMETEHSTRLEFVPKGDPDSIETLLSNWEQAIPNTYPEPTEAQLLGALAVVEAGIAVEDAAQAIADNAETGWDTIPAWASWTATEAENWIENNVTDLASAKVVMKKMAQAIMFLADKNFPNRR